MRIETRRGPVAAVDASRVYQHTFDREVGQKAAMRYLRAKDKKRSHRVKHSTRDHENAMWAVGGFILGGIVGLAVMAYAISDIFNDFPPVGFGM